METGSIVGVSINDITLSFGPGLVVQRWANSVLR